ncbi:MAG TPA: hypothetical protein VMR77_03090 [Patescibacteria group bacterium]|jgi:hypothetical protein|nr:hypothetical protein [Patescibacteria group bacterium]
MQLLNFILFLVLVFLVVYLPGRLLLRLSGYKFASFLITISSSLVIGLAVFLFGAYLLSWIKIPFTYNLIIPIALLLEFKNSYAEFKRNIKIRNFFTPEALLIVLGSTLMAYTTWNSGTYKNGEMLLYGVNGGDSVYHLALIGSLISNFPPFHPGLAGVLLRGYNFFYDFLISNFAQFYHFNPLDLFFRYFSFLISLILGFSSLSLAKFLKWKKITVLLFIFLMYFVQSFDFFAYYLYRIFNYYYNSAGITQSLGNALDPSIVISASFIFIGFVLLFSKGNKWSFLLPVLVIGVIPQIKIYAGIIFYLGLAAVALWELCRERDTHYSKILILSGVISALVYLPLNYGAGGLMFAPLVIYKNFIDSAWIFNNWHWNVNFPIYVQAHNYIHIAFFYAVAIAVFLITSLGIRVVVLLGIKKVFNKKFYSPQNIFWSVGISGSLLIPSFFIQSISEFSIIQFFWVGYIILLVPTAAILGEKLEKRNKIILTGVFLFLIVLFLPDTLRIINTYSGSPGRISSDIVSKANIISNIPQNEGVIVADRFMIKDKYQDVLASPIVSALSGHAIYYEHELTEFQGIDKITNPRKDNVDKIYQNMVNCSNPITAEQNIINIMRKTNNKYLLILEKNSCTSKFSKLKIVNDEGTSVLYKI